MNITIALYSFQQNAVTIKTPFEITKETPLCYFTAHARYLKSQLDKPVLRCASSYPYIELVMIDADEETLKTELSRWFIDKANRIREKVIDGVSVSVTAGDKDPYSMLAYYGYHGFPFPLVVLFEDEGKYTVAIKDKEARIEKVK